MIDDSVVERWHLWTTFRVVIHQPKLVERALSMLIMPQYRSGDSFLAEEHYLFKRTLDCLMLFDLEHSILLYTLSEK